MERRDKPRHSGPLGRSGTDPEQRSDAEVVDDESHSVARRAARVSPSASPCDAEGKRSDSEHPGDKESVRIERGVEQQRHDLRKSKRGDADSDLGVRAHCKKALHDALGVRRMDGCMGNLRLSHECRSVSLSEGSAH